MFDKPRLALALAYVSLPNMAMLALANLSGVTLFAWFCESFVGFGSLYIVFIFAESELDDRRRLNASDNKPSVVAQPEPRVIRNMGAVVSQFTTPQVQIDVMKIKAKRCCRTLINQREQGFKVDLREKVWKAQFGGRDNFVYFRDVYMAGAFAKVNPELINSPFIVVDWRVVEQAANGRM